jgi:DNA phosphorothioation-dependent restriction protein DptH
LIFHEVEEPFVRKFAWRLPETHTFRMAKELIEWAVESIAEKYSNPTILPAFHIPYHEELIRAKDDDETRRVLLHAIRDVSADSTNLITEEWRQQNDPLLPYLRELAIAYRKFLSKAKDDGLHSIFHKVDDGQPSPWEELHKAYETAARAYCGADEQCRNSPMAAMLMRSFLIVASRGKHNHAWVADPYERSGVATILHPAVLEMLCDHIGYLFACFNYAVSREWRAINVKKPFHLSKWQDYLDLSTIQMPLGGLIGDENLIIDTQVRGQELIHCVGSPASEEAPLSTRLLLRYEGFDEEDIADTEMFAETRESRLICNILRDYLDIHPHARDGFSMAVYRNEDIQPVISAVHAFLSELAEGDMPVLGETRNRRYAVTITVFTEAGEDVGVSRWIEQWKERWEAAESEEKYAVYRHCLFSIAHRVVPSQDINRKAFARMIRESLDVDIAVLYDFIGAGLRGNEFQRVATYDVRERTLKFPIIEKSFCTVDDPQLRLRRARVISNPQFRLSTLNLETMARLKNSNTPPGQEHVLMGYGDYSPWQEVVDELHKHAEWVVCIDPSIDDKLIKMRRDKPAEEREIIGFGSGVGLHGELNFTISTEHFRLTDIRFRMERAISALYPGWHNNALSIISESVIREARTLSGLSLVRATGVGTYLHDFFAYSMTSKILTSDDDLLCNHLISLDAYRHWFTQDDQVRPDLLWMVARLDKNGRIILDMHLIECKMGQQNKIYLEKAAQQIQNGFSTLIPAFMPRKPKGGDDVRPDQRYWWLQLHRLIASKAEIKRQRQDAVMAAMERLADGDYIIAWQGAVLAFWTDSDGSTLDHVSNDCYEDENIGSLQFGIYSMGRNAVHDICTGEKNIKLDCPKNTVRFGDYSVVAPETLRTKRNDESEIIKTTSAQEEKPIITPLTTEHDEVLKETKPVAESPRHIQERILLGKTAHGGREVFWELVIGTCLTVIYLFFGTSGMGKTYAIQCLLCEMGRQQQNVLVMDYTNGSCQAT